MTDEYRPWTFKPPQGGVIGMRRVRRQDGLDKASGKAVYARDVQLPGMLYAKPMCSPFAHAKIKGMDTSKAEALPGVRAVLRYDDPEFGNNKTEISRQYPHQKRLYEFLWDTAYNYGQQVGVVVCADSQSIVDEALRLIKAEWEELPFILDWEKALEPGAPLLRPDENSKDNIELELDFVHGNVEDGFKKADHIIEWKAVAEEDVWAGVEAMVAVAEWNGDYLNVWQHGQHPTMVQCELKRYTTMDKIFVHSPYNGALFGGITFLGAPEAMAMYAAILSKRTGKPVKMLHDGSHFDGAEEKMGSYFFKVGYKDDGSVTALDLLTYYSAQTVHDQIVKFRESGKCHDIHHHDIQPFINRAQPVCYKHGAPACYVQSQVYGHVADALKMDPTKVALINDGCEGISMSDVAAIKKDYGFDPTRDSLKEVIEIGKKAIDWDNRWHEPGTKLLPNGKYHGIGFMWTIGWNGTSVGALNTGILMRVDGTVNILAHRADIGTAPHTTYSQVVADEMGMLYKDVTLNMADEIMGFEIVAPGGSHGLVSNIPGMVLAARQARQMLLEYAVKSESPNAKAVFPDKTPAELDIKESVIFEKSNPANRVPVATVVNRFFRCSSMGYTNCPFFVRVMPPRVDSAYKKYNMVRQCYFMEVEVDPDTGQVDVVKVVVVNDVGRAINPDMCNGQQYGGTYMGVSITFNEQIFYDPATGVKLNDNLISYPAATVLDCGDIDTHLVETGLGWSVYGTCGIGESAAACVRVLGPPAIYNALGVYIDDLPVSPDKILRALKKA
jgi:CO/xanthine dehydrogenase Mo-binding subunit